MFGVSIYLGLPFLRFYSDTSEVINKNNIRYVQKQI